MVLHDMMDEEAAKGGRRHTRDTRVAKNRYNQKEEEEEGLEREEREMMWWVFIAASGCMVWYGRVERERESYINVL